METEPDAPLTPDERDLCVRALQRIADKPALIQNDERMKALLAKIHRQGKKGERRETRNERITADRQIIAQTAMVSRIRDAHPLADDTVSAGAAGQLVRAVRCYVCKAPYTRVDAFYHQLCPACATVNHARRHQRADLSGRRVLLTGGRVKIGYQLALRLLRDGATVLVTTRFPDDARRRFAEAPDYSVWSDRLRLHGIDLRNLPAVEAFAGELAHNEPHLDILINNAAQTIKRPLAFYRHLLERETSAPVLLEAGVRYPALLQSMADGDDVSLPVPHFPHGMLDADGQQEDLRPINSWILPLGEVGGVEALEVHLVNAVAPLILCDRLLPLLRRSPHERRFIVNVSAMEGQFSRNGKTPRHPHTNMAKAALNMLTRTSAGGLAQSGIYMNSVDTGWVTDEKPHAARERVQTENGFFPPLDALDGAQRVYDPIARGINEAGEPVWGQFLKDYAPCPW